MPAADMSAGSLLILAIDTSHRNGSICLARGDARRCEVLGSVQVDGGMFSAQLVPAIAKLLKQNGLDKKDLRGIAAAVGPGSFTGLRIGLAAVKGLAEVLDIPIAAVSTLEALAAFATDQAPGNVLAILDAGRGEFYVGEYANGGRAAENLFNKEELVERFASRQSACVVSSEPSIKEIAKSIGAAFQNVLPPDAQIIGRIGLRKLIAGQTIAVDELDANYLRRDQGLFTSPK